MTINKIIFSSDFLRYGHDLETNNWYHNLFGIYLERVQDTPVFIAGNDEYNNFFQNYIGIDIEKFYAFYGIKFDKDAEISKKLWCNIFNNLEYNKEAFEYIYELFKDSLVMSHECPNIILNILEYYGIPYIDTNTHPIRFLDDQLFGFRSNNQDIYNELLKYNYNEDYYYIYANFLSTYYNCHDAFNNISNNSVLFCGQANIDKSIIDYTNGTVYSILSHKDTFESSIAGYDKIYFKKHPYFDIDEETKQYLLTFSNLEFIDENIYKLLSCKKIKKVVAISSSVLIEAKYFNKETQALLRNSVELQDESNFDKEKYISIFGEYFSFVFWSNILKPILNTKEFKYCNFSNQTNRLRNIRSAYWGYCDPEQEYILKLFENKMSQISK